MTIFSGFCKHCGIRFLINLIMAIVLLYILPTFLFNHITDGVLLTIYRPLAKFLGYIGLVLTVIRLVMLFFGEHLDLHNQASA